MAVKGGIKLKVVSANIGPTRVKASDLGKTLGKSITATVERGVRKMKKPMENTLNAVFEELKKQHSNRWTPTGLFGSRLESKLHRRTGKGLRSIRDSITVTENRKKGVVGSITAGDLSIHESGGVVRPTSGKYLAIPTIYVLTGTGRPRVSSPREWPNTFARRTENGHLFVFQRQRGNVIIPLYLLKRRVRIPPRLGLRKAVTKYLGYFRARAFDAMAKEIK